MWVQIYDEGIFVNVDDDFDWVPTRSPKFGHMVISRINIDYF